MTILGIESSAGPASAAVVRDGRLLVTLQAECREEIGRFVPLDPASQLGESPE